MDLLAQWHLEDVDHDESLALLIPLFRSAGQMAPRRIEYALAQDGHALSVEFTAKGRVCAITPGPMRVFRRFLTCSTQIVAAFRHEHIQLLPLPEGAPALDCMIGEHPLLLEMRVQTSLDGLITARRVTSAMNRSVLLLAGLTDASLRDPNQYAQYHWVRSPDTGVTTYAQEGYGCADVPMQLDTFSTCTAEVPGDPALRLYGWDAQTANTPWRARYDLGLLLTAVNSLSRADQERVLRSCYWIRQAYQHLWSAPSMAFLCLTSECEVLFERAPASTCPTCTQKVFAGKSLTTLFAEFLKTHGALESLVVKNTAEPRDFKDRLTELYARRSSIVHGTEFSAHEPHRAWTFSSKGNLQDHDLRTFLRVMHYALGSWIRQQTGHIL